VKKSKFVFSMLSLVFLFSLIFVGYAQAATPSAATLRAKFDQVDQYNKSTWESYKTQVDNNYPTWEESYVTRAYLIMYKATKDESYLNLFTGHIDSQLNRRDNIRKVTDYRGLSLPAWRNGSFTNYQSYWLYAVQTGVTVQPMAEFAAMVYNDPALSKYKAKADVYLQAAKDAVKVHDMRDQPKYLDTNSKWIEDSATMHLNLPINMNLAQGSVMFAIYEATGDKTYLDKATKITNYFKKYLILNTALNAYTWKYFPDSADYGSVYEDTGHVVPELEFINYAYKHGLFSDTDMQRFANTATKIMVKSNGSIAHRLDGSGTSPLPGTIAQWLWFAPWAPSLIDTSWSILANQTSVHDMVFAGLALLNYTVAQGGQNSDPTPIPGQTDNLITNGDFSSGLQGWANETSTAVINTESNGNKYVSNNCSWGFYQKLNLQPGDYKLNMKAKKGTANMSARVVVQFFKQDGTYTVPYAFKFNNNGSGWEAMPEMTITVPSTTAYVRIYPSVDAGSTGTYYFDDISLVPAGSTPAPAPDTESPQVTVTAPAAGVTLKDTAVLTASAGDNQGVESVTFAYAADVNGSWTSIGAAALQDGTKTSGAWQLAWDVSNINNGTYYVRATAKDAAGNSSASTAVSCIVSNTVNNQANLITNGDFSSGLQGWANETNTALINTEANGNKYVSNSYSWGFYQKLILQPDTYKLNMKAKKGTANMSTRIVVQFFKQDGTYTVPYAFKFNNTGGGWEAMPEMTITVPDATAYVRIYPSVDAGSNGTYYFDDVSLVPAGVTPAPAPDTESPQVTVTAPAAGITLKDKAILTASAGDNQGVESVTFAYTADVNGTWTSIGAASLQDGTKTSGAWQLAWDVSNINNGTYYVRATAKDAAGNSSTSTAVSCVVNNTANNQANLITNGDFSAGLQGWANEANTAVIDTEANGNKYVSNNYSWGFYQKLNLQPGTYKLNMEAKKGTANMSARVVVQFFKQDGSYTVPYAFKFNSTGAGWEAMPEMTITVPAATAYVRIYPSVDAGSTGAYYFDDITLTQVK